MTVFEGGRVPARASGRPHPPAMVARPARPASRWDAWHARAWTWLPGPLGLAAVALLCMGFGALMARSAGFMHQFGAVRIDTRMADAHEPAPGPAWLAATEVRKPAVIPARVTVQITPPAVPPGWSCPAAVAYLSAHAAPGFSFVCPGYALGHQAMTCDDVPGVCSGRKVIVIAVPCPAAYENEAWNSRVMEGLVAGRFDPYGYCRR